MALEVKVNGLKATVTGGAASTAYTVTITAHNTGMDDSDAVTQDITTTA